MTTHYLAAAAGAAAATSSRPLDWLLRSPFRSNLPLKRRLPRISFWF